MKTAKVRRKSLAQKEGKQKVLLDIQNNLIKGQGRKPEQASDEEMFKAVALSIREQIMERWLQANEQIDEKRAKRLYYLSAEFLTGRVLVNNMINLGMLDEYKSALAKINYPFEKLEEQENEAALGNGGLGRLAACFLDSLSTLNLPVVGHGIRYEYGLFRQQIVNGEQVEMPDDWTQNGVVWEIERPEEQVEVCFEGTVDEIWTGDGLKTVQKNCQRVLAIPCDMPVIGYNSRVPASLRLWRAACPAAFDLHSFNKGDYICVMKQKELAESISKVLYPEDNHITGRMLRLKQYYFLASAAMQSLVREHKKQGGDVRTLPQMAVIQINDTHPAMAIPELMRILLDEEGLSWDEAYGIVEKTFNYTNHTVLSEALEVWPEQLFASLLPRIYMIVKEISNRFSAKLWQAFSGDWDKISRMAIIAYDEIRMANLCIAVCSKVNGVSQLHGAILKTRTFRDFFVLFPDKFTAVTNGITQRRWLSVSNPALDSLLRAHIGDRFLTDYKALERINDHIGSKRFLADLMQVKAHNKQRLAEYVKNKQGVVLNPQSVFDVQAKRLHEYKRQLLKVLHILHLYNRLTQDSDFSLPQPVTFLFAAKASPAYHRAKKIIRLINAVGELVRANPRTKEIIDVVFLENYNVSLAEKLIPAADISEQISTAGREASGTGNMKFMLGGAVTLGTMDGANVEIYQQVGADNIFIFGASAETIARMEAEHSYDPKSFIEKKPFIKAALSRLTDGSLAGGDKTLFEDLVNSLLVGDYDPPDKYFVLHDLESYDAVFEKMMHAYADKTRWSKMSAHNTANAGFFSSDRTIEEYNQLIWGLTAL